MKGEHRSILPLCASPVTGRVRPVRSAAAFWILLLLAVFSLHAQSGPPLLVTTEGGRVYPLDLITFPDTPIGRTSREIDFTVRNVGLSALALPRQGAVAFSDGDTSMFVVTRAPADTLPIQERIRFSIAFKPTSFGEKSATVTLTTDNPDYPTFTFDVAGNATAPPSQ